MLNHTTIKIKGYTVGVLGEVTPEMVADWYREFSLALIGLPEDDITFEMFVTCMHIMGHTKNMRIEKNQYDTTIVFFADDEPNIHISYRAVFKFTPTSVNISGKATDYTKTYNEKIVNLYKQLLKHNKQLSEELRQEIENIKKYEKLLEQAKEKVRMYKEYRPELLNEI